MKGWGRYNGILSNQMKFCQQIFYLSNSLFTSERDRLQVLKSALWRVSFLGTVPKGLIKENGEIGDLRKNQNNPDHITVQISKNTEKCPGYRKILAVTHTRNCPVGWGSRIHRLLLWRGVRPPKRMSWLRYLTIWWGSSNAGALGNAEYHFIAITSRSTLVRIGSTW